MWPKGTKLVCIEISGPYASKMNWPKIGEIVTCAGRCPIYEGSIDIVEYPRSKEGNLQSFSAWKFRPVEPRHDADVDELIQKFTVPETLDAPQVPQIETA